MEIEPADHGALVPVFATEKPALNDPLWKDLAKDLATSQVEKLPVVGTALRVRAQREQERRLRFLEQSLDRLSLTFEEWDSRLQDDEELAELIARAWDMVAEARSNEKVRILAAVAAAATAGDRMEISVGHVMLGVVEALEPLHLQTLVHIDVHAKLMPPMEEGGEEGIWGARRAALEGASQLDPEVVGIALADLEAKQLISNAYEGTHAAMEGKEAFVLTNLGDQVRRLMLDVAQDEAVNPT